MEIGVLIAFITLVLKTALIIWDKLQKTPNDARRAELAKLDAAMEKADQTKDLSDLSKFLGGHL